MNLRKIINIFFWLLVMLASFAAKTQELKKGIQFSQDTSWAEVLNEAAREHKPIFVDCYATWCGPCKYMSTRVFATKEAGEYFNSHFINVTLQMDRTAKDPEAVKNWYNDAKRFQEKYQVNAYPTFLFFSSDGTLVHRFSGSSSTAADFINKAQDALDPDKQYYTLLSHWRQHQTDSVFLLHALTAAIAAEDIDNARLIGDNYLASIKAPAAKSNVELFIRLLQTTDDPYFKFFEQHVPEVNSIMADTNYVQKLLAPIIFKSDIEPTLDGSGPRFNWIKWSSFLKARYPSLGENLMLNLEIPINTHISNMIGLWIKNDTTSLSWDKIQHQLINQYKNYPEDGFLLWASRFDYYYTRKNPDWRKSANAFYILLRDYGQRLPVKAGNNICWNCLYLHCSDDKILIESASWLKQVIDTRYSQVNYEEYDTYAHLLYKAGDHESGVRWENKAIEMLSAHDSTANELWEFRADLDKMKMGVLTWKE